MPPVATTPSLRWAEPVYRRFHDLMPFRVREVLLVSSAYDAFILEEDGHLTERLFLQYSELNLSSAPRITHASTGSAALDLIERRRFDLVIVMPRLADSDVFAFGRRLKERHPNKPLVVLGFNDAEISDLAERGPDGTIDGVFVWIGDARILLTMIKVVEDARNAEHDIRNADVQAILVVEDSVKRYSTFLTLLYAEVMSQSNSLISEGLNDHHRLMRMRARPKILLATTYEEARGLFLKHRDNILALITDVSYRRGGQTDPDAGFRLVDEVLAQKPDTAVLVQSSTPENAARAALRLLPYADKGSPTLLARIHDFLQESLGFGDFVFRMPDGRVVGRAHDMFELEGLIATVPEESLYFHSSHNHFGTWLMARSMFALARMLLPLKPSDFPDGMAGLRAFLVRSLHETRVNEQLGMITDFTEQRPDFDSGFVRVGKGSLGGKGRGLAFLNQLLTRPEFRDGALELPVRCPPSVALCTTEFERFSDQNGLWSLRLQGLPDDELVSRFCQARLPDELSERLAVIVQRLRGPLAVRSSSLLEDSQYQPFAGIYATYMLPNNDPDPAVRHAELCRAVQAVYASTWGHNARAYMAGTPNSLEEERMAVVIQQVVGRAHGQRFYPLLSGVAHTHNYYPVGSQRAEDGLALVALGLGHTVVHGDTAVRFSPASPGVLPQFTSPADYLKFSQRSFLAIDLGRPRMEHLERPEGTLRAFDLADAEADGTLAHVGSVYSADDDAIRDGLLWPGPRLVTFHGILKWGSIELAATLRRVLSVLRQELGCAAEIEFALDLDDDGEPQLYLLQVRPSASRPVQGFIATEGFPPELTLCRTDRALGHGVLSKLCDVVYVRPRALDSADTPAVAAQVGQLNAALQADGAGYLLIGPGRWGSSDPRLGIPVDWSQIAGARVIAETDFPGMHVEPSQGTHFFQNMISRGIGYLTLFHSGHEGEPDDRWLDLDWLEGLPALRETADVRHVRLDEPLLVQLDGQSGRAIVLKRIPSA